MRRALEARQEGHAIVLVRAPVCPAVSSIKISRGCSTLNVISQISERAISGPLQNLSAALRSLCKLAGLFHGVTRVG
jgi:hypothetical protein